MISFDEFLKNYKDSGLSEEELAKLYFFMEESTILICAGRLGRSHLFKLENEAWAILKKIDINFARKAVKKIGLALVKLINEEKRMRNSKWRGVNNPWEYLRGLILRRAEYFSGVFKFNKEDLKRCEHIGEELRIILSRDEESVNAPAIIKELLAEYNEDVNY